MSVSILDKQKKCATNSSHKNITYLLNSAFLPHEQQGVELSKWRGSWAVSSGKTERAHW